MTIAAIAAIALPQLRELSLRAGGARYISPSAVADSASSAAGKATAAQQQAAGLIWRGRGWIGLDPIREAVTALHRDLVQTEEAAGLGRIIELYKTRSEWADTAAARAIGLPVSCRHPIIGEGKADPWGGEAIQDDNGKWVSPSNLWQWIDGMAGESAS